MYGAATGFGPGACRKAGRPWHPGSRVLTTRAEDIASTKTAQQNSCAAGQALLPCQKNSPSLGQLSWQHPGHGWNLHCLPCPTFWPTWTTRWLELVGLQESSKICSHSLSGAQMWHPLEDTSRWSTRAIFYSSVKPKAEKGRRLLVKWSCSCWCEKVEGF